MPVRRQSQPEPPPRRRRPATSPEGRENEMVSLAYELAEKRIRGGTASAQEVTHFLKLGSSREQLEQKRLSGEVELMRAKIDQLESQKDMIEMYTKAMDAMVEYKGHQVIDPDDYQNE